MDTMEHNNEQGICVSFLVVVRNEEHYIEQCLMSILNQTFDPKRYEIIVVDGMSTDRTRGIVERLIDEHQDYQIRLLDNPGLTLSKGWNIGIRASTQDIVCRPDAHSKLDEKYVISGVEFLLKNRNKKIACVGGVLSNVGHGVLGRAFADFFSSKFGVGCSAFRVGVPETVETDTAVFALYWRDIFNSCGCFDENLVRNQDIDLHRRLRQKGYKIFTNPEMKAEYYVRSKLRKFQMKAFSDGYWVAFTKQSAWRHKIPLCFTIYLLISIVGTAILVHPFNLLILGPLLIYIVLGIVFALRDGHGLSGKVLMLGLYPLYHLSYGFGSLWAIITKPFKFLTKLLQN